jgi:hypothetical protein
MINYFLIINKISVDSDMFLMTDFINLNQTGLVF